MTKLSWTDFADAVGTAYQVEADGATYELTLVQATQLTPSIRQEGSFRLEFRGPYEPILPQAIYPLRAGDFECEMFIVPIDRNDAGTFYEAIFN